MIRRFFYRLRRWVGLKVPSASPPPPTVEERLANYTVTVDDPSDPLFRIYRVTR